MHYFEAADGARIAFQETGSGRPLLLLHGLMAHSGFFAPQRELQDEFRLITPDLRGHGHSATEAATVEQLAEDVERLLAQLGVEDAIGVGWSLGASVLWTLLSGPAAARFAGAVIVDMTPRVLNGDDWDLGLAADVVEARRLSIREDFEALALGAGNAIFAQPIPRQLQETAVWAGAEFARSDGAAIGQLWASLAEQDFRSALSGMSLPTLVIHGARSHLYGPGTADYLIDALPNARAVRFDHSGHAPHIEQPELFNRTIREFAERLPRAPQSFETISQA